MASSTRSLDDPRAGELPGQVRLEVVRGPDAGRGVALGPGDVVRVGTQADCHLVVRDDTVSRQHLEVRREADALVLADLGSKNGSFLGGSRFAELAVRPPVAFRIGGLELRLTRVDHDAIARLGSLVATSAAMRAVFERVRRAARSDAAVLVTGETGTGKEGIARALHDESARAAAPYVVVDLASITESLIDSELFGHVHGAFTGAAGARTGGFEEAGRGTVFLDEIGELALTAQPRLLRVLESGQVKPVGGNAYVQSQARVVAATNRSLAGEVAAGRFRADLYHRLAVLTIELPPLRERPEDLPILVETFAAELPAGLPPLDVPAETLAAMAAYDWPGNVRQLRKVLERAAIVADGGRVTPELLGQGDGGPAAASPRATADDDLPFKEAKQRLVDAWERDYLARLVALAGGNVSGAARVAGLARVHLHRLLKKHGLGRDLDE